MYVTSSISIGSDFSVCMAYTIILCVVDYFYFFFARVAIFWREKLGHLKMKSTQVRWIPLHWIKDFPPIKVHSHYSDLYLFTIKTKEK